MATRKQIREAVAALISPEFAKVFSYNVSSVDPRDFPLAMAYIDGGDSEGDHSQGYDSEATLAIEIWANSSGDIDSALDELGNSVNALIDQDDTLGGLVNGIVRNSYNYVRDTESFNGTLLLTYQITYEDED